MSKEVEIFRYTKADRFAVVRKMPRDQRHRCDFKFLHASREAAEAEALRLTEIHRTKFYIVEIVGITSSTDCEMTEFDDKSPVEQQKTMARMAGVYSQVQEPVDADS